SELMLATGKLSPPLARRARSVISASQRAASLTTQLLLLSRKPSMQAPAAPTGNVAREAMSLLRRLTPELPLRVHVASNAGEIAADPAQLGQVLVNLVIHLRDALPPDRPLAIRVKRV